MHNKLGGRIHSGWTIYIFKRFAVSVDVQITQKIAVEASTIMHDIGSTSQSFMNEDAVMIACVSGVK